MERSDMDRKSRKLYNSPEFITHLIRQYKERPCLWKVKSTDYQNRELKNAAYNELLEYVKNLDPQANIDKIKQKINSLRRAFRKELNKVKIKNAKSEGEVYTPNLWYYDMLLFTADQDLPGNKVKEDEDSSEEVFGEQWPSLEGNARPSPSNSIPPKKRLRQELDQKNVLNKVYNILDTVVEKPCDEFDAYAMTVAAKLRRMDPNQRIYCEYILNTALHYGMLNKLNENSTCTLSSK